MKGRRKTYKPNYITVRLPTLYKGGKRVKTSVEEELEHESDKILNALITTYSAIYGELDPKLSMPAPDVKGTPNTSPWIGSMLSSPTGKGECS